MCAFVRNNGQLRSTLNKARTLCDKWRGKSEPEVAASGGRLSRWFSIRRGSAHQYDVDGGTPERTTASGKMPLLPEVFILFIYCNS